MHTIVSAVFDLYSADNNIKRGVDEYILLFQQLPINEFPNLIIFTDSNTAPHLEKLDEFFIRHKFTSRLKIIEIKISDLEKTPYEEIKKLNKSSSICDTIEYITLVHCKPDFLKMAVELDPFRSDKFCWIDFGITHIAKASAQDFRDIIHYMPDKMRICIINPVSSTFLEYKHELYREYFCGASAGILSGSKEAILEFHDLYMKEYNNMISLGYYGLDEVIIGILLLENESKFVSYYASDYDFILKNTRYITDDINKYTDKIKYCNDHRMYEQGSNYIFAIIYTLNNSSYTVNSKNLILFLYYSIICLFYVKQPEQEEMAIEIARVLSAIWDFRPVHRGSFPSNWKYNLSFYNYQNYKKEEFYNSKLIKACISVL